MRSYTPSAAVMLAVALWPTESPALQSDREQPREVELRESTARRLAQIDVTVTGAADVVATLTAADFELVVNGRPVEQFFADSHCSTPAAAVEPHRPTAAPAADGRRTQASPGSTTANYLLYFDQAHLTPAGRARSIDLARKLVRKLAVDGDRASVVSAAQEVRTFAGFTPDRERLLEALDELSRDRSQWDSYAMLEESRVGEVQEAFGRGVVAAAAVAKRHAWEDRWRTEKALRRLSMVIGRLTELPPPRTLIYFADRMRSRPGEHYLYLFSLNDMEHMRSGRLPKLASAVATHAAGNSYDRVVREANGHGVRLYTVQAEGLVSDYSVSEKPMPSIVRGRTSVARQVRRAAPIPGAKRIGDAQDSLAGFALETGGRAFLNGVAAGKIARQIRSDVGCLYLLSFDPTPFPEDESLSVFVRSRRAGVQVRTRSRTVLQSEGARLRSRLMSAFAAPEAIDTASELETSIVPTGYRAGEYSALMQLTAPGSPIVGAEWDLGASLISRGRVTQDASGRISVRRPGVPVVFESEMRFRPGPYEIVAVAHDNAAGEILTGRNEGTWPDPDDAPATLTPIAVIQTRGAAFSRDGELRTRGSMAFAAGTPVRIDRPTALVGLVCRQRKQRDPLAVDRILRGASEVRFDEMRLDPGDERCTQIRDIIPPGTMTAGGFVYEVRVLEGDSEVARGRRQFFAVGPDSR